MFAVADTPTVNEAGTPAATGVVGAGERDARPWIETDNDRCGLARDVGRDRRPLRRRQRVSSPTPSLFVVAVVGESEPASVVNVTGDTRDAGARTFSTRA